MTRTMLCALILCCACGSPAPSRDDATAHSDAATRADEVDCATAMASLRRLEIASLESEAGKLEPLVGGLNRLLDLGQYELPSAKVDIDDVKRDVAAKLERRWPKLLAAATAECVASAWSADARACFARVNTEKDAEVCTSGLKGSQVRRLKAVILRIARGDQPGIEQLIEATLLPEACAVYKFYSWRARTCMQLPGPERDRIADDLARMSAGWDLDGDTDILSAPCQTAADRIAARFEAVGCKLDDGLEIKP
jgi:hypothetical protein